MAHSRLSLVMILLLLSGCQIAHHSGQSAALSGPAGQTNFVPSVYRGSAGLDGRYPGRALRQMPAVKWKRTVGGESAWQNEVVLTERAVYAAGDDGNVYALDRKRAAGKYGRAPSVAA
ncbi:PQQ-binding-like beta-propeller repeat protein [Actinoplanes sp. NPDC051513]|uniref:PQQ-binding-like beta-propeller repeat protein n=1 Tax=Actinoplanes sp. NPDC051513 TaxID=3363908 RepID=UPI003788C0DB